MGSWKPNGDSQVYCELKIDAGPALKKIDELNKNSNSKITMTHMIGKVMGRVLKDIPDLNSVVRLGTIYPRKDIDIFFHVVYDETELSGHVIRKIDQKSTADIAHELTNNAKVIKTGDDLSFKKIKNNWNMIPGFLAGLVLDFIGLINYTFNLNVKALGVPRDCFGSMMITNIGSLGFSSAFVPLAPYTRIPFIIALGKVEWRPYADSSGNLSTRQEISLCCTFDHRVMDGAQGAKMSKLIEKYMNSPELL